MILLLPTFLGQLLVMSCSCRVSGLVGAIVFLFSANMFYSSQICPHNRCYSTPYANIALSSIGAALELQKGGVSPEMKIFWRLNSTSILFLWLAAKKINRKEFARFTSEQMWIEMPFAAANYAVLSVTFACALDMTSLVNAFSK